MEQNFNDIPNFENLNKLYKRLEESEKRQDEFDRKLKNLEREKSQQINELSVKLRRSNEINERLSSKLNDLERTNRNLISKFEKTSNDLYKKFEEMQQQIRLKESQKETIIIDSLIQNNSDNNDGESKNYYFVCPYCKCRNPFIEEVNIDIDLRDFNVSYYCACNFFNNKGPNSSELSLLINENLPTNSCPIHSNKTLKLFCIKCKKSYCELCKKDKDEHQKDLVNYTQMMSVDNAKLMEMILEKYDCQKKNIYKKIIGNYFNLLKKIDIEKYHLKQTLSKHKDRVSCIILLQSGFIATGSDDRNIRIWDIENSTCINKIEDIGAVSALLEFEPGKLISASNLKTILLWDINSNRDGNIDCFSQYSESANFLVKCDHNTFVSVSYDPFIIKWDYNRRNIIKKFELHNGYISALIKLNDDNLLALSHDKLIKIWDWNEEKTIKELPGHNDRITCLCQMNDEILLSGSYDKTIKVWKNYKCIKTIDIDTSSVNVLIKINNDYFAGTSEGEIIIWNINNFSEIDKLTGHNSNVSGLIKANNNELISCSYDSTIKIWEKN